ncbi:hypothetical protein PILCRDRAFT_798452 [Piloderma croceum F 1598]|uniref:CUE domain-containing protein n=1 Tax=Piloderma croceum (strain F 1598) TaxID=765440 RepID=A0A0C3F7S6_PILCF|nr:hypothetical protein PILCRDRAFT_798452 [Piloderma croceum F 1598]
MTDDDQPTSQSGPPAYPEAHETTPEAASAEPTEPTSAAEAPISHSTAAASTASPPPPTTIMTEAQDTDAPSLPARPSAQETTSAPTAESNLPPSDPRMASLQAIFPTFDEAVLQSVLESVGGNQDRAIDMLLGMSDPNYVPQEPPAPVQSQTELDEEFARRLMLEDQQQFRQPQSQGRQAPYQPRVRGRNQQQQGGADPQSGQQQDTIGEFQEQFAKIADTGKKTFTTIFGKVKAKMQEFDQSRTGQSSAQAGTEPSWGTESTGGPPGSQSFYESQQSHNQPSYYDPNPQRQRTGTGRTQTPGYDVTALQNPEPGPAGGSSPPPTTGTPPPPSTSSGAPAIDPSKLGMLPKRPVSLLRSPNDPAPKPDDDDELEYAENPFEEHE